MKADEHEDEANEKTASDNDVTFDRAKGENHDESEEDDSDDDEGIDAVCFDNELLVFMLQVTCVSMCTCVWDNQMFRRDKAKGVEGIIETENPNRVRVKMKKAKDVDMDAEVQLSRRER